MQEILKGYISLYQSVDGPFLTFILSILTFSFSLPMASLLCPVWQRITALLFK